MPPFPRLSLILIAGALALAQLPAAAQTPDAPTLDDGSAGEVHRTALAAKAGALVAAEPSPSALHPFNLGFRTAQTRGNEIPNLKESLALRRKQRALFKIAICVRAQSDRAKSRFKWEWRHRRRANEPAAK